MEAEGECTTPNNELEFLETPSYQIMTVFALFIGITLVADWAMKRTRKFLERLGSKGLIEVYHSLLLEFVFLGLLSFLLDSVGSQIRKIWSVFLAHGVSGAAFSCPFHRVHTLSELEHPETNSFS